MPGLNPFSTDDFATFFDPDDAFVPEHLPDPIGFLLDQDVLEGTDHVEFHAITHAVFESRGVYDMTFGYNLAELNLDHRHPNAGYRYARERENPRIIRAAFTPTTSFCPQAHTLTIGSFRAWNGLRDDYPYDRVRVRIDEMHHNSEAINAEIRNREEDFTEM